MTGAIIVTAAETHNHRLRFCTRQEKRNTKLLCYDNTIGLYLRHLSATNIKFCFVSFVILLLSPILLLSSSSPCAASPTTLFFSSSKNHSRNKKQRILTTNNMLTTRCYHGLNTANGGSSSSSRRNIALLIRSRGNHSLIFQQTRSKTNKSLCSNIQRPYCLCSTSCNKCSAFFSSVKRTNAYCTRRTKENNVMTSKRRWSSNTNCSVKMNPLISQQLLAFRERNNFLRNSSYHTYGFSRIKSMVSTTSVTFSKKIKMKSQSQLNLFPFSSSAINGIDPDGNRSKISENTVPKLPSKWQNAVRQIPKEHILPDGEFKKTHKLQAFFGDKTLSSISSSLIERSYLIQELKEKLSEKANKKIKVDTNDEAQSLQTQCQQQQQQQIKVINDEINQFRFLKMMNSTSSSNYLYNEASATKLISTALSNQFFATHIKTILPPPSDEDDNESSKDDNIYVQTSKTMSIHSIGTMIEAAVAAVHQQNGREAVIDLVDWLLVKAIEKNHDHYNTKGKLLELGGTIKQTIQIGGTDHEPIFESTATVDNVTQTSSGRSKKIAEQDACRKVLQMLGYIDMPILEEISDNNSKSLLTWIPPTDQWNYFEREDDDDLTVLDLSNKKEQQPLKKSSSSNSSKASSTTRTAECKNDPNSISEGTIISTPEEWWMSRAFDNKTSFRATMLSPTIFPNIVAAVDSWTRRPSNSASSATTENKVNNDDSGGTNIDNIETTNTNSSTDSTISIGGGEAAVMLVITFYSSTSSSVISEEMQRQKIDSSRISDDNDSTSFAYEYITFIEQHKDSATKARSILALQANEIISKKVEEAATSASLATVTPLDVQSVTP